MNKKALWFSVSAVVAMMAVVVGGTFALFSANTTSTNNFTSGQICLTSRRDNADPVPGPMFYVTPAQGASTPPPPGLPQPGTLPTGFWAPGDVHERTLIVDNECLPVWANTVSATLVSGDIALADKLNVVIRTMKPGFVGDHVVATGTLSQFLAGNIPLQYASPCGLPLCGASGLRVPMASPSTLFFDFEVTFDSTANNTYQNKTLVVHFNLNAVQQASNP